MSTAFFDPYKAQPGWKGKRLTPTQLLVHNVSSSSGGTSLGTSGARLNIDEVPTSSLMQSGSSLRSPGGQDLPEIGSTGSERQQLQNLQSGYGWLNSLRVGTEDNEPCMCRWIHISSKCPEYLQGVFLGLSDWVSEPESKLNALRQIDRCVRSNERFSKHGKYFSPFLQPLYRSKSANDCNQAILASFPFLDWTVPNPPPLRFQIDDREKYASSSAFHPLRSILQHYYRLEDTSEREKSQVFARHQPWNTDREIDLKVRRWYGHHPSALQVDELWVIVIDSKHIVTFSGNQTWKSRWPPLQLSARIAQVSFRRLRNLAYLNEAKQAYTALMHAVVCIHGAVGLVHRGFWTDLPLPCSERFAGYLGHLQYRLYRSPTTKLVMDLLQVQDELNIVLQITKSQERVLLELEQYVEERDQSLQRKQSKHDGALAERSSSIRKIPNVDFSPSGAYSRHILGIQQSANIDSAELVADTLDLLHREDDDLTELRNNASELANRTVQLVNIRLEDHGQAILVFTLVTVIFLPLSFLASFFSMNGLNVSNIQVTFWPTAVALTVIVVAASSILAFYGNRMQEKFVYWKDNGMFNFRLPSRPQKVILRPMSKPSEGFVVVDQVSNVLAGQSW